VDALGRSLVILGIVFVAVGLLLHASPQIPLLGKLPGDLRIERPGFRFYFPLTTCLVLSAVLSLLAHLFSRLR
jgi:hypothetical protein